MLGISVFELKKNVLVSTEGDNGEEKGRTLEPKRSRLVCDCVLKAERR